MFDEDNEEENFAPIAMEVERPATAIEYLRSIYRNPAEPEARRMRAAIECLPYENPKLSAMAVTRMTGKDFAATLDRAIARSRPVLIEAKAERPQAE